MNQLACTVTLVCLLGAADAKAAPTTVIGRGEAVGGDGEGDRDAGRHDGGMGLRGNGGRHETAHRLAVAEPADMEAVAGKDIDGHEVEGRCAVGVRCVSAGDADAIVEAK